MSSPKNMSESFESYLTRVKAKTGSSPATQKHQAPVISNQGQSPTTQASGQALSSDFSLSDSDLKLFSPKTQALMANFKGVEQKKILKFWYEMTLSFGQGKIRQEFGDEPDRHIMMFAASLTENSYNRLKDNLEERLKKGQEWPPSFAVFKTLKDTPTDREVLEARTNILTLKQPVSRVEIYIKQRKSAKLRTLSEKYIVEEFRTLYLEAFEEVILYDQDKTLNAQESEVQNAMGDGVKNKTDKRIDDMVASDYKLTGSLGGIMENIEKLRKQNAQSIEEIE